MSHKANYERQMNEHIKKYSLSHVSLCKTIQYTQMKLNCNVHISGIIPIFISFSFFIDYTLAMIRCCKCDFLTCLTGQKKYFCYSMMLSSNPCNHQE